MSKIIILADPHAGVHGRLRDIMWSLRVISKYATNNNIDTIVGLGDLFHNRTSLEIDVLCCVFDFFEQVRKYQQWIWIPGNHDMFLRHSWAINSIKPLSKLITFIGDVKLLEINKKRFWTLPFIHFESAYMKVLKKIEEQYEDGDVLLTHTGTTGAIKNTCFLLKEWGIISFHDSKFKQVYTGHFHSTQQVGHNVWYPGSTIPFKADEGDCQHGFFIYDLETCTHEFKDIWEYGAKYFPDEIPPHNYLTIADTSLNMITKELANNNVVRVAINSEYTDNQKLQINNQLIDLGAKEIRWVQLTADEAIPKLPVVSAGDSNDLFEAWLKADSGNLDGLSPAVLRRLNTEVVKDGDDRYEYSDDI